MNFPVINSATDVTDDNIASLSELAQNLSYQDDDVIQTITSSQVLDPEVQKYLASEEALNMLREAADEEASAAGTDTVSADEDFGLLVFPESISSAGNIFFRIKSLFTGLRRKVRRIFCQVVSALGSDEDLDLKQIIKDVILALIPALAASTGLLPIALPIVVSLAAMLIKYGVSQVCPA